MQQVEETVESGAYFCQDASQRPHHWYGQQSDPEAVLWEVSVLLTAWCPL